MLPKVSIVIPVFNGADYLDDAIQSALAQTYPNVELIIVNDGSDDDGATERIALKYGSRLRYFSKPNGGVASALNLAVSKMSGAYFSWLSHDDLYCPAKVAREMDTLFALPVQMRDRAIIYSDYSVFSTDLANAIPVRLKGVPPEQFRYWITVENALHGCTLLVPAGAFAECGGFNEDLRTTQDYDLWFRLAARYHFVHLPEMLVKARSHPGQGSIRMARTALEECNTLLSGFVRTLTGRELGLVTEQAPSIVYAKIAASMWHRGFRQAGQAAASLARQHLTKDSLMDATAAIRLLTRGASRYYTGRLTRPLLPAYLRLKIKALRRGTRVSLFEGSDLKHKFSQVYENNTFGGRLSRSGEGSDLVQTAIIRKEIPKLIRTFGIKTFLDAPCGDWYWMSGVRLGVDHYIGIDIVEPIIEKNRREFGSASTSFQCLNLAEDALPCVDLVFSRDCLVHLSNEDGLKVLANFKRSRSKYLLITTFTGRERNNQLRPNGEFWRPLNMRLPPFSFPEPLLLINEGCTEENGRYSDKSLGLWLLQEIAA